MSEELSKKRRVLFVIYQTGVKGNGGVQSITKILEGISPEFNIHVLTQEKTPFNSHWESLGAKVIFKNAPESNVFLKVWNLFYLNVYCFFYCLLNRIAVLHCNDIVSLVNTCIGSKLAGCRVIYNVRAVKPPGMSYSPLWKLGLPFVNKTIVLSDDMRLRLEKHHPALKGKTTFAYSIIDFEKFKPITNKTELRRKLGLNTNDILLGIVGRFQTVKQQDLFLSKIATSIIENKGKSVKLVLIGDFNVKMNAFAAKCLQITKELGIEKSVIFKDFQSNIQEWYAAFDVTIVPSSEEGLARCMIESMSCGTPVVSFDVSSAKEILLDHNCGYVAALNDFDTLKDQVNQLVEDDDLRRVFGEKSFQSSRKLFASEAIIEAYSKLYR